MRLVPPAHVLLQSLQAEYGESWQWTGQRRTEQSRTATSVYCEHDLPPKRAGYLTERSRCCEPWPQEREHLPHLAHDDSKQSVGLVSTYAT